MKRLYLITLPERLWHWLNAALFITLALTGLLMHDALVKSRKPPFSVIPVKTGIQFFRAVA